MDTQTVVVSIKNGEVINIQTVEHIRVEIRDYDVEEIEDDSLLETDEKGNKYRWMGRA